MQFSEWHYPRLDDLSEAQLGGAFGRPMAFIIKSLLFKPTISNLVKIFTISTNLLCCLGKLSMWGYHHEDALNFHHSRNTKSKARGLPSTSEATVVG